MDVTMTMPEPDANSSLDLLLRAQSGDDDALNRLLGRYIPRLESWASGRMSPAIRSMNDTADLVQEAVISALRVLPTLEIRSEGALLVYLREVVRNRIIDQYRRHNRRPERIEIPIDLEAPETSPLEAAIGVEAAENYERALASLSEKYRQLIVLRVDFQMKTDEIARMLGLGTADAARMVLNRAFKKLAEEMRIKKV